MKKDIPKEFLKQYEGIKNDLEKSLSHIQDMLQFRLSQLKAQKGTRARMVEVRLKRPGKIWKNAKKRKIPEPEILSRTEDLLGVRIVCNNLTDAEPVIDMIRHESGLLKINEIKRMTDKPTAAGYRAIHVRAETREMYTPGKIKAQCEIQIRTLAQDTWARLSRADLYGRKVPKNISKLTQALSKQLSAIDEIAQLIRDELDRPAGKSKRIKDSDPVSPQRLALLYEQIYGEELYEWSLNDWVLNLGEAEIDTIGEVRTILNDTKLRDILDRIARRIRKYSLDDREWAVNSALVASEIDKPTGIKAVKKDIQEQWDEITAQARSSMLPGSIDEFIDEFKEGFLSIEETFSLLDCIQGCERCGIDILVDSESAAQAVADYYEAEDRLDELYELIEEWRFEHGNSMDGKFCSYCDYQISKDD
jgi:ppGpp synthetase/RelA/SpoT-type nucleotidyltranferase